MRTGRHGHATDRDASASREPTVGAAPALDALRAQLGDAVLEARIAEARKREEVLARLLSAIAAGMNLEEAAQHLGSPVSASTLRRWLGRWRALGVAGLVDQQAGPPRRTAQVTPAGTRAQLSLGGIPDQTSRERRSLRRTGRRGAPPSPLIKWSGSKAAIAARLVSLAPAAFGHYHEPFVGGGALFFALRPGRAFLGDRNAELVNLYQVVRDSPEALIRALSAHENTRERYLAVRGIHPEVLPPIERAARTLFLNRTCFNGLYRVNRHGLFNVPYGSQAHTSFFQPTVVRTAHRTLRGADISCEDFEACAKRAGGGDFIYLDPPYAAGLRRAKSFKYQADGFDDADQRRVADLFRLLDRRGCFVMASNADCALTRELYRGYDIEAMTVPRRIGGAEKSRGRAAEIVVRNYGGRRGTLPGI